MDGLIKMHYINQRTSKDFATSFKIKEPSKPVTKDCAEGIFASEFAQSDLNSPFPSTVFDSVGSP